MEKAVREGSFSRYVAALCCERCGTLEGVSLEDSRTYYDWNGEGEDPNRPIRLCRQCAAEHHDYWDAMWAESGLL
jgi:hypothetical protein